MISENEKQKKNMPRKIIKLISASVLLMTLSGCSKKQQSSVNHGNKCTSSSGLLSCGQGKLFTDPFFNIELNNGLINIDFTWKGVNANVGYPLNRSKLECKRLDGFCTEISAVNIVNNKIDHVYGFRFIEI
jgi:hypothetical protein